MILFSSTLITERATLASYLFTQGYTINEALEATMSLREENRPNNTMQVSNRWVFNPDNAFELKKEYNN